MNRRSFFKLAGGTVLSALFAKFAQPSPPTNPRQMGGYFTGVDMGTPGGDLTGIGYVGEWEECHMFPGSGSSLDDLPEGTDITVEGWYKKEPRIVLWSPWINSRMIY